MKFTRFLNCCPGMNIWKQKQSNNANDNYINRQTYKWIKAQSIPTQVTGGVKSLIQDMHSVSLSFGWSKRKRDEPPRAWSVRSPGGVAGYGLCACVFKNTSLPASRSPSQVLAVTVTVLLAGFVASDARRRSFAIARHAPLGSDRGRWPPARRGWHVSLPGGTLSQ